MQTRLPIHLLAILTAFAMLAAAGIVLAAPRAASPAPYEAAPAAPRHPVRLDARFDADLGGLSFGSIEMTATFDGPRYHAASLVRTEGIADLLLRQVFDLEAEGTLAPAGPATRRYTARNMDQDDLQKVEMVYAAQTPQVVADPPYDNADRLPVSPRMLAGTVDPLTSMLVPGTHAAPEACNRTVPVYDGRRRYDFRMRFEAMSEITPRASAYAGPAVRCSATLVPLAGYKRKTVREMRRDPMAISVWLAPVAGAGVLVPVRIEVATPIGTLVARTTRFDVARGGASHAMLLAP